MNATACASSSLPTPTLRPKKLQSVLAVFEATIDQNAVRGDCNSKSFLGNSAAIKSQRRSSLDGSRNSGCVPAQAEIRSATNPVTKAIIHPYQRRASVGSTPMAVSTMPKAPCNEQVTQVVIPAPSPVNGNGKSTKETGLAAVQPMDGATSSLVAVALDNPPWPADLRDSNIVSGSAESPFDVSGSTTSFSPPDEPETDTDESEASLDNLWDSHDASPVTADSDDGSTVTAELVPLLRRPIRRVGSSATVEFHDSTDNMHADYFLASFEEQKRLARLRSIPQCTKSKSLAQSRPLAERMQAFGNTAM
jgi:hypothetical protein